MKKRTTFVLVSILALVSMISLLMLSACTIQEATAAPQTAAVDGALTQLVSTVKCTGDCATCANKDGQCDGTCENCTGDCADCQEKGTCNGTCKSATSVTTAKGCSGGGCGGCTGKMMGKDILPEGW